MPQGLGCSLFQKNFEMTLFSPIFGFARSAKSNKICFCAHLFVSLRCQLRFRGRVQLPTGGHSPRIPKGGVQVDRTLCEGGAFARQAVGGGTRLEGTESVKFRCRRYSPDDRMRRGRKKARYADRRRLLVGCVGDRILSAGDRACIYSARASARPTRSSDFSRSESARITGLFVPRAVLKM